MLAIFRRLKPAIALLVAIILWHAPGTAATTPLAPAATNAYEFRQSHNPDGIGKFYMRREIAQVMGHEAAAWLERPEREAQEHTGVLLEELHIRPGQVIADIGAGTGYFSRRLAKKVGPTGQVLAVDVQPEMLLLLTNSMAHLGISNVVTVLGSPVEPNLPADSVDLALMVDVYHEFDFPLEMMNGICRSLKPDGRVVFVEYRGEDQSVPIKPLHKMTEAQVKREMSNQPLEWVQTSRVLPWQHIIIFRKARQGSSRRFGLHRPAEFSINFPARASPRA